MGGTVYCISRKSLTRSCHSELRAAEGRRSLCNDTLCADHSPCLGADVLDCGPARAMAEWMSLAARRSQTALTPQNDKLAKDLGHSAPGPLAIAATRTISSSLAGQQLLHCQMRFNVFPILAADFNRWRGRGLSSYTQMPAQGKKPQRSPEDSHGTLCGGFPQPRVRTCPSLTTHP